MQSPSAVKPQNSQFRLHSSPDEVIEQRFDDVRLWHKADISRLSFNVRFWG
jgi:hypothetical protein